MRRKSQVAGDLFKGSFNRFKAAVRVAVSYTHLQEEQRRRAQGRKSGAEGAGAVCGLSLIHI